MKVHIKKVRKDAILPQYQTEQAAGMDLVAMIDKSLTLAPRQRHAIPTGIAIALPEGYEAQIRSRSGLANKYGITLVQGVGTIDADYRGEIHVLLINHGSKDFTIEPGARIAQMIIAQYEKIQWQQVNDLNETARGQNRFGSTGI